MLDIASKVRKGETVETLEKMLADAGIQVINALEEVSAISYTLGAIKAGGHDEKL